MSAVIQSFRRAFEALPASQREGRAAAWACFESQGLPTHKLEDWHYTDLSALIRREYTVAPPPSPAASNIDALEGAERVLFVNGRRIHGRAAPPVAMLLDDPVTSLNAALYTDGLSWDVGAGQMPPPKHLIMAVAAAGAGGMLHLRHRIRIGRGAQVTLILDSRGDDSEALATVVSEIELDAAARLHLVRLQNAGSASIELARTQVRLARDAQLHYVGLDIGGRVTRHDLNIDLAEPGASAEVYGVFAPSAQMHSDTHTCILHSAPHCRSREIFRGLVMDRARAVFNGKIVVQPGAQKTDSEQHVASLLLSPQAEVDAKPELEIYADDVKCAHGATCGRLDEMAIYYLRSRGLDRNSARNLLLFTFAREVLGRIAWEPARLRAERCLTARLPSGEVLEELL